MRLAVLGTLSVLLLAADAHAQTFPASNGWTALKKSGADLTDATGDGANTWTDVIGAAGTPAVQIGSDGAYFFFRIRLNGAPQNGGGWRNGAAWGCVIDSDGVASTYEWLAVLDGAGGLVRLRANTATAAPDSPSETADTSDTWSQTVTTAAVPSNAGPFFVDFAILWSQLPQGPSLRFACGAAAAPTNIGGDPVAGATANASATLTGMWSTPYVCTSALGCRLDTDGDSIPDADEPTYGTDPNKADSDGDGIPDNVELTVTGATGTQKFQFSKIDTDNDGLIDALDTDSDNDCVLDKNEAATWRNAALPNANANANCANPTPLCNTGSGACLTCNADFGGGGLACWQSTLPACQTSGALAGSCTVCKPGLTTGCTNAAQPACEATTGVCAGCNGDNGSNATAVCPSAATPACQKTGALVGRCTICSPTNTTLCTSPTAPLCNASGNCAPCDGDHNGGTTLGCATSANPVCVLGDAGANVGSCGRCTSNADCGKGHAGPTCDIPTGACVDKDSDGDGLNDSVELILGTDPLKKDTDGDGLDDMIETTFIVGGSPTKIDSDNDGTIDALDLDSDDDGVLDAIEGTQDLDSDTVPNFRDPDDDGDQIPTKEEIALAAKCGATDDVDKDGAKNFYDKDADGDGKADLFEGTGDDDGDGIPNFLDPDDHTKKPVEDAGTPIVPPPPPTGDVDAGVTVPTAAPDDGVLEGNGFACRTSPGGGSGLVLVGIAAIALATARRRRR